MRSALFGLRPVLYLVWFEDFFHEYYYLAKKRRVSKAECHFQNLKKKLMLTISQQLQYFCNCIFILSFHYLAFIFVIFSNPDPADIQGLTKLQKYEKHDWK